MKKYLTDASLDRILDEELIHRVVEPSAGFNESVLRKIGDEKRLEAFIESRLSALPVEPSTGFAGRVLARTIPSPFPSWKIGERRFPIPYLQLLGGLAAAAVITFALILSSPDRIYEVETAKGWRSVPMGMSLNDSPDPMIDELFVLADGLASTEPISNQTSREMLTWLVHFTP